MDAEVKTEHQRALTALPQDVLNIIFEEALPVVLKTHHSMCVFKYKDNNVSSNYNMQ